ncbi:MAG TPA: hypothetical protein VE263_15105 [Candidatus Angelobacter sp.]|nr:hypothetical protein [Candidatus Angelobacter sp.]
MDGTRHKEIIQSWFNSAVHEGGIDRYDDLHIDQIDAAWKPRSKWIAAAVESFETALEVRDDYSSDTHLTIVMAFALASELHPLGVTFQNRSELEDAFSSTPPSLYLFREGGEFWTQAQELSGKRINHDLVIKALNASELFGKMRKAVKCIYMEYLRIGDEEYSRDVFLAG